LSAARGAIETRGANVVTRHGDVNRAECILRMVTSFFLHGRSPDRKVWTMDDERIKGRFSKFYRKMGETVDAYLELRDEVGDISDERFGLIPGSIDPETRKCSVCGNRKLSICFHESEVCDSCMGVANEWYKQLATILVDSERSDLLPDKDSYFAFVYLRLKREQLGRFDTEVDA
jgi:hypothetical protein